MSRPFLGRSFASCRRRARRRERLVNMETGRPWKHADLDSRRVYCVPLSVALTGRAS